MNIISKKIATLLMAGLMVLSAAGCSAVAAEADTQGSAAGEVSDVSASSSADGGGNTIEDPGAAWSEADASAVITLADSGIEVTGQGAAAEGSTLTISAGGLYVLRGSLSAGQIKIEAPEAETVRLVLDGVDITAAQNAALYAAQCDELIITLAEGSENTLRDAEDFSYADATAEEPDAALFSKDDLTLNGAGSLNIEAGFNNGIGTKDDLVITGGSYTVTAANHALRGRDSVTVQAGSFTLTASGDGIQSNNDEDTAKGWVNLSGGSYTITAGGDGIQAETALTIGGGTFDITTGGGHSASVDETGSYKGLKGVGSIEITGGSFAIDSADDTIHSNGSIAISEGDFALATGDDGVHADGDLTVSGGSINITTSFEGLEASTMTLAGGDIALVASDDGINIAGGTDGTEEAGPFGGDTFAQSGQNSARWLLISGGTIRVDAAGDGIDVNGSAEITGGEVYVDGPISGGDGALDYDGSFEIGGGSFVAVGSSGMAMGPSTTGAQPSLMVTFSGLQSAGSALALLDASGETLMSFTPAKEYQTVILSCPALAEGEDYTLTLDGKEVVTTTLSGAVTSISDTGEAVAGGMGGMGGGRGEGGGPGGGPMGEMPAGGTPPEGGGNIPGGTPPDMPNGTPPTGTPGGGQAAV